MLSPERAENQVPGHLYYSNKIPETRNEIPTVQKARAQHQGANNVRFQVKILILLVVARSPGSS